MITDDDISRFRAGEAPQDDTALAAMWWADRRDWSRAHDIVQRHEGETSFDLVHAWLHQQEGDLGNARYWYRRAGMRPETGALASDWTWIARHLLAA